MEVKVLIILAKLILLLGGVGVMVDKHCHLPVNVIKTVNARGEI